MRQFLPVAAGATTPYGVPSPSASVRSQISDGLPGLASGSRFVSLNVPFALVLRRNLQIFESSLDPGEGTGVQLHTPNPRVIRARPKKKKKELPETRGTTLTAAGLSTGGLCTPSVHYRLGPVRRG